MGAIVYSTVYSGADKKKKKSLRATGLCAGNSPADDRCEFPAQKASNAEMFPLDYVIMAINGTLFTITHSLILEMMCVMKTTLLPDEELSVAAQYLQNLPIITWLAFTNIFDTIRRIHQRINTL